MNTVSKLAQLARANQKKQVNPDNSFEKKVSWGSHQYVRYVKERCKGLAMKGFGGVEIKIDKTTDFFQVDEGRNSCYSHDFVVKLLQEEGFELINMPYGCYDAQIYTLIWDYELPFAPSSEKIGMSWK